MNRFVLFAVLWLLLSAYGFFMRPPGIGAPLFPHFDKFAHFVLFFGQMWLVGRSYTEQSRPIALKAWWLAALAWAIATELIQSQLPDRSADAFDVLADMCGATAALWLAQHLGARRLVKDKP